MWNVTSSAFSFSCFDEETKLAHFVVDAIVILPLVVIPPRTNWKPNFNSYQMRPPITFIGLLLIVSRPIRSFVPHLRQPGCSWFTVEKIAKISSTWTVLSAKRVPRANRENGSSTTQVAALQRRLSPNITRAPHQFDHRLELARPFIEDIQAELQKYNSNDDAPLLDLQAILQERQQVNLTCVEFYPLDCIERDRIIENDHIVVYSLDELFPGLQFSDRFSQSAAFRNALRMAIREDVFDTTESYHSLSDKAKRVLLLPDASLQGSWKCQNGRWYRKPLGEISDAMEIGSPKLLRMIQLTAVLQKYLGSSAPTGDVFMNTIGALCGSNASSLWTDTVGISKRRVPHSWQHDSVPSKTVVLGFPPDDDYQGLGVFPHFVKLNRSLLAADGSGSGPVDFDPNLLIEEDFIVRPRFALHREILAYSNVKVLTSEPDISFRTSCMRFS